MWREIIISAFGVLFVAIALLIVREDFPERPDPDNTVGIFLWELLSPIAGIRGTVERHRSQWAFSDLIDPLTDDRVLSATGRFRSSEGFNATVELKCVLKENGSQSETNPRFRIRTSFFESESGEAGLLKISYLEAFGYARYGIRFGDNPNFCQIIPQTRLEYSNSLNLDLRRPNGRGGLSDFYARLASGHARCPAEIDNYDDQISAWIDTGKMIIKPRLRSGSPVFTINTNHPEPARVIEACRSWFGLAASAGVASASTGSFEVTSATPNGGVWLHNGSKMGLYFLDEVGDSEGHFNVEIRYIEPRAGLVEQGVERGTLLFNGTTNDTGDYQGTARIFSKRCGDPMEYAVAGSAHGEHRLVLESQRPVRRNCQQTGETVFEELEFSITYR